LATSTEALERMADAVFSTSLLPGETPRCSPDRIASSSTASRTSRSPRHPPMSGPAGWRGCRQVSGDGAGTTTGPPGTTLAAPARGVHDRVTAPTGAGAKPDDRVKVAEKKTDGPRRPTGPRRRRRRPSPSPSGSTTATARYPSACAPGPTTSPSTTAAPTRRMSRCCSS
jgi:hypothetical protein